MFLKIKKLLLILAVSVVESQFDIWSYMDHNITLQDVLENCPNFLPEQVSPKFDGVLPLQAFIYIKRIVSIDDSAEDISFTGFLEIHWDGAICSKNETFANLNSSKYAELMPNPSMFWKPAIEIPQSQEMLMAKDRQQSMKLVISNQKEEKYPKLAWGWDVRGEFRFHCELDLFLFPNDVQNCSIQFQTQKQTFFYKFTDCSLLPLYRSALEKANWDLLDAQCHVGVGYAITSTINISFKMARNPRFYLIHVVTPCVLLLLLELCSFALPAQGAERTGFTMTIYLAFVFIESFLLTILPRTPKKILLADFIMFQSIFSTIITVYSALLSNLSHRLSSSTVKFGRRKVSWLTIVEFCAFSSSIFAYGGISIWIVSQIEAQS